MKYIFVTSTIDMNHFITLIILWIISFSSYNNTIKLLSLNLNRIWKSVHYLQWRLSEQKGRGISFVFGAAAFKHKVQQDNPASESR